MQLLPLGGTTRLPSLAALRWIIAYYVEIGKIRGTDCRVAARLAMTGRGIDKDLKAGIMIGKRGRCSDWVSPSCGYEVTAGL